MADIYDFLWFCSCLLLAGFIFRDKKVNTPPPSLSTSTLDLNNLLLNDNRIKQIDGLRYILASFVAYHHLGFVPNLFLKNQWTISSPLQINVGHIGVGLFFIISGYLFAKLKVDSDWISFFIKRICRIFPIFTLSSLGCIVIASYIGYRNGYPMDYSGVLDWLNGGLKNDRPHIWGYQFTYLINAGVTWTLEWEWMFYFTVPVISILIPIHRRFIFGTFIIFISAYIINRYDYSRAVFITLFAIGFCTRNLPQQMITDFYKKHRIRIECCLLLGLFCFIYFSYNHYSIGSAIFFGFFFLFIAVGANLFGLLTTSGFVKLGDASYSIYLLHGIFWFIMTKSLLHFNLFDNLLVRYTVQSITWLLICFVSLKTYKYIELPAINFGKRFSFTDK